MDSWEEHARRLATAVAPPGSRWREVVARTRRHPLVPRWWASTPEGWKLRVGGDDHERWLAAAYRDWTLVTRVGGVHADHAAPDACPEGAPTSSSTLPGLLVSMFRHASIGDRSTVLDVGTGTGYGTALLCARLGHGQVTAIDVDPYLTAAAERRLGEMGLRPELRTGDATGPIDWYGDRIIATVAVRPVPASWLRALRPGGRLVTTIAGTSLVITADKQEDGGAAGRVEWDRAGFMRTRAGADYPAQDLRAVLGRARVEDGEQVEPSPYPVMNVTTAWDVGTMLELIAPGIQHRFITYDADPDRVALMAHPDGSWARAEQIGGRVMVHQSGPRRLHDLLDQVREHWLTYGELPIRGAEVAIDLEGVITLRRGGWTATIGGEGCQNRGNVP
ncbi:methyltransferase domain-containing protein [Nonomuraea sp. LP-02]|uniref:methyltransferase domain-containing protein n=1 Tax=Nonomuraea sp. LP-02 TaxID=3097960 RepID=UPI002E348D25|nr:methyltransferase domain-containing protein [Nonomuraea sp. LP-02]MED7926638.1 methyltransferase domain-containing protein [Nonomuraea sp. LP-02]